MARNFFDSLRTVFSLWTKHSFLPFFALSGFIFHLLLYHPPLENCGFPVLKPFCSHFGNNDSENEFVKSLMNYSGYVKNYGHVPLWVLTNVMDFGTINSLYKNMPFTVQNNVAKCFSDGIFREYHTRVHLPPNYFWKFMYAIQELRNTCGHNNRLLNHNFKYSVPFISFLYSSDYERSLDRSHVYDIYLATKLFLPKKQFDDLTRAIKKRMRNYLKSRIKSIPCTVILDS